MWCRSLAMSIVLIVLYAGGAVGDASPFAKSYAVVIGIDTYPHRGCPKLSYAVKDARGVAEYLGSQGFEVVSLFESQATRQAIVATIEDQLARKVTASDRVLFFFAGHGATRQTGEGQRGYLVPYDGTDSFASLLAMNQIHDFSS